MALSDKKKVQTMVNIVGQAVQEMRDGMTTILAIRVKFNEINPDVTGTPLDGNLAAVNAAINSLDAELGGPVWDGMIAAIVPSHRNKALD